MKNEDTCQYIYALSHQQYNVYIPLVHLCTLVHCLWMIQLPLCMPIIDNRILFIVCCMLQHVLYHVVRWYITLVNEGLGIC